jgi:hypothetical protein
LAHHHSASMAHDGGAFGAHGWVKADGGGIASRFLFYPQGGKYCARVATH